MPIMSCKPHDGSFYGEEKVLVLRKDEAKSPLCDEVNAHGPEVVSIWPSCEIGDVEGVLEVELDAASNDIPHVECNITHSFHLIVNATYMVVGGSLLEIGEVGGVGGEVFARSADNYSSDKSVAELFMAKLT
jgi:hypothetical protein